jgi:hypothetical protein
VQTLRGVASCGLGLTLTVKPSPDRPEPSSRLQLCSEKSPSGPGEVRDRKWQVRDRKRTGRSCVVPPRALPPALAPLAAPPGMAVGWVPEEYAERGSTRTEEQGSRLRV